MTGRFVVVLLAQAALVVSGAAWAAVELPVFRLDSPETARPHEEIIVAVTPVDGAWLYAYPLDQLVGLFELDDLDHDLRPISSVDYGVVELRPDGDGRFTGSISAPVGDYALVPYPEVIGELPADGAYPEAAPLSVVPPAAPTPSGRPTGLILVAAALAAIAIVLFVDRWIRRRRDVDDYFERDFRDPPAMGGIWPSGGSGGGGLG